MNQRTRKIIGWVLAGLLALVYLGSAFNKISGNEEGLKTTAAWGISADALIILGVIEIISIILFTIPRTSILGFLLLVAYMGGAIATHLEHGESVLAPAMIASVVWITGAIRIPELFNALLRKNTSYN
jgi:DoxX-like family